MVISAFFVDAVTWDGSSDGSCLYSIGTAPPPEAAYGPQCSVLVRYLGAGGMQIGRFTSTSGKAVMIASHNYGGSGLNVTGSYGYGVWGLYPGGLKETHAVAAFLRIE